MNRYLLRSLRACKCLYHLFHVHLGMVLVILLYYHKIVLINHRKHKSSRQRNGNVPALNQLAENIFDELKTILSQLSVFLLTWAVFNNNNSNNYRNNDNKNANNSNGNSSLMVQIQEFSIELEIFPKVGTEKYNTACIYSSFKGFNSIHIFKIVS